MKMDDRKVAIIGLGYVGLPLAIEFARHHTVVGFDTNALRISELRAGRDSTLEVSGDLLASAHALHLTHEPHNLSDCDVFIVTVPTPVDRANRPDLGALGSACELVGSSIRTSGLVIFESTVYPGCTEEFCVPIIEKRSGLRFNLDFFCGYSPERINPGDKTRRLPDIVKITSGSTFEAAEDVDRLYRQIIRAGTHRASSIKVAEAAKVIENTQRDLNIALMNEFSLLFRRLEIDTGEVLEAAETKWNFLRFRPGLVGGHCIGVDPYYLTHKAQEVGYHPDVIMAGRRINDGMARHVAEETVLLMVRKGVPIKGARILVLGVAFKENCPDTRNSKVFDLIEALERYECGIDAYDPWVDPNDVNQPLRFRQLHALPSGERYDAIIVAVAHEQFVTMGAEGIRNLCAADGVIYDVKGIFARQLTDARL